MDLTNYQQKTYDRIIKKINNYFEEDEFQRDLLIYLINELIEDITNANKKEETGTDNL